MVHKKEIYAYLRSSSIITAVICTVILCCCCSEPATDLKEFPTLNKIKKGSECVVRLAEDHGAGENWKLHSADPEGRIEETRAVWHGKEKGVYFHFNTVSTGTAVLYFTLIRMKDSVAARHYMVEVVDN